MTKKQLILLKHFLWIVDAYYKCKHIKYGPLYQWHLHLFQWQLLHLNLWQPLFSQWQKPSVTTAPKSLTAVYFLSDRSLQWQLHLNLWQPLFSQWQKPLHGDNCVFLSLCSSLFQLPLLSMDAFSFGPLRVSQWQLPLSRIRLTITPVSSLSSAESQKLPRWWRYLGSRGPFSVATIFIEIISTRRRLFNSHSCLL